MSKKDWNIVESIFGYDTVTRDKSAWMLAFLFVVIALAISLVLSFSVIGNVFVIFVFIVFLTVDFEESASTEEIVLECGV